MSQHGNPLLTREFEQSIGPVDVCANDQNLVSERVQDLLYTLSRSSSFFTSLAYANLYSGQQIIDVLTFTIRIHEQQEMLAVPSGKLDARKENWCVVHIRNGVLKGVDSLGRVVVCHRDGLNAGVAGRCKPAPPVWVLPI